MAVPQSAYTGDIFNEGTTASNANTALIAVPDVDNATLKSRFYLDITLATAEGAANNALTKQGFIGGCIIGSDNYYMHNISRIYTLEETYNGQDVILFNDAGLNTLGKPIGDISVISREFVGVRIDQIFRSAWYVFSDICGLEARFWDSNSGNWGGWVDTSKHTMPQSVEDIRSFTVGFTEISEALRTHGFQVRPYLTNLEGTYTGEVSLPIFVTGILTTLHLSSWGGTVKTYYRDTIDLIPASQGQFNPTRLFVDEGMSIPYEPQGVDKFYYEDEKFITYGYSQLFDYYAVLTKGEDTIPIPTEPPSPFMYKGFDANSQVLAEEQVLFNTGSNTGTIYLEEVSGIAYKSYSGSYPNWVYGQVADRGYYANGNTAFVTDVIYVGVEGDYTILDPINQ